MNCSGTPGMGGPLAEGARTVPVGYALPADYGNPSGARSFEGDARNGQGYTSNVSLPPSFGGVQVGGNPQSQVLAAGNVAQFPGLSASGGYGSGELEALLNQLQYVSNGPRLPLLEVLANMNLGDEGWLPVLHRLASSTGNEAYGQASAPNMVDVQCQSDDHSRQWFNGISGMCTPHPGAVQCGPGNPVGSRCSTGNVGPGCLRNPSYASRPVVTVGGQCADSGGVLPESFMVSGGNMPHPMGSVRAGDTLGDRGFEVTAPIQSGPSTQALRPSTVSGLASSGGALQRS